MAHFHPGVHRNEKEEARPQPEVEPLGRSAQTSIGFRQIGIAAFATAAKRAAESAEHFNGAASTAAGARSPAATARGRKVESLRLRRGRSKNVAGRHFELTNQPASKLPTCPPARTALLILTPTGLPACIPFRGGGVGRGR